MKKRNALEIIIHTFKTISGLLVLTSAQHIKFLGSPWQRVQKLINILRRTFFNFVENRTHVENIVFMLFVWNCTELSDVSV